MQYLALLKRASCDGWLHLKPAVKSAIQRIHPCNYMISCVLYTYVVLCRVWIEEHASMTCVLTSVVGECSHKVAGINEVADAVQRVWLRDFMIRMYGYNPKTQLEYTAAWQPSPL